jgi:hypothetical protein
MNMTDLTRQMDDSFRALRSMHRTEEHCDQLMELSRNLMLKIEQRDAQIEMLRAQIEVMKQERKDGR